MSAVDLLDEASALVYYGELGHVENWRAWRSRLAGLRSRLAAVAADRVAAALSAEGESAALDLGDFVADSVSPLRDCIDRADDVLAARRERCGLAPAVAVPAWAV